MVEYLEESPVEEFLKATMDYFRKEILEEYTIV